MNRSFSRFALGVLLGMAWLGLAAGPARAESAFDRHAQDLKKGMQYKRMLAIEALGRFRTPEARELLIDSMLHDKSRPVRRTAQRMLANVNDPRIYPAIQKALTDRERRVRLAGIEALGLVRDPTAADHLLAAAQRDPKDREAVRLAMEALREFVYRTEPAAGFERGLVPFLQDRDKKIRRTVVAVLGVMARPASLDPLLELWPKADAEMRVRLADAFANIGWAKPAPVLTAALSKSPVPVMIHSLYALSQIQAFSCLPEVRALLGRHKNLLVKVACLNALLEIPDPESVPAVVAVLSDPEVSVRHWACYALGQLKAVSAIPTLREQLDDPSPLVQATAITALAELGDLVSERTFLAMLETPSTPDDVRMAALKALMRLESKLGAGAYWNLIKDPSRSLDTRLTAALALGRLGQKADREILAQNLDQADFTLAFASALALGILADERASGVLVKALEHGHPSIRRFSILGLERLRSPEVSNSLANTANDDPDPLVRILCAASLVSAGFPDFRVLLWNALDNRSEDLRIEAVIALARDPDPETRRQLKWYLRREPSVPVRETILRALREG